jgi:hypothetical protein
MTKAGLAIFICESISMHFLFKKYFGSSATISLEEFLCRATAEDVVRLSIHQRRAFLGFCIMTMGRLFQ